MRENLAHLILGTRTLASYLSIGLTAIVLAGILSRTRLFRTHNYTWGDTPFDDDRLGPHHWNIWPRPLIALLPFPVTVLWLALLVARGGNSAGLWPLLHWLMPAGAFTLSIGLGWITAANSRQRHGMLFFHSVMLLLTAAASAAVGGVRFLLLGPQPWTAIALAGCLAAWWALLLAFVKIRYFDRAPWDWLEAKPATGSTRAGFIRGLAICHCLAVAAIVLGVYASRTAIGQISWADFAMLYSLALTKQQLPTLQQIPLAWITASIALLSVLALCTVILLVRKTRASSLMAGGDFHLNQYPRRPLLAGLLLFTGIGNLVLIFFYLTLAWQVRPYLLVSDQMRADFARHWLNQSPTVPPPPFRFTAPDGTAVTVSGELLQHVRTTLDVIVILEDLHTFTPAVARPAVLLHPGEATALTAMAKRINGNVDHPLLPLARIFTGATDQRLQQLLSLTEPGQTQALIATLHAYLQRQANRLSAPQGYGYLKDSGWILPYVPYHAAKLPDGLDKALRSYASANVLHLLAQAQPALPPLVPDHPTTAWAWTQLLLQAQLSPNADAAFVAAQAPLTALTDDLNQLRQQPDTLDGLANWLQLAASLYKRMYADDAWQLFLPATAELPTSPTWQVWNQQLTTDYAHQTHQRLRRSLIQHYDQVGWNNTLTQIITVDSRDDAYLHSASTTTAQIYDLVATLQKQDGFPVDAADLSRTARLLEQLFEQRLNLAATPVDPDKVLGHLQKCDQLLGLIRDCTALDVARRQQLAAQLNTIVGAAVAAQQQRNKPDWADQGDTLATKLQNLLDLRTHCRQSLTLSPIDKNSLEDELAVVEFAIRFEQLIRELSSAPDKTVQGLWRGLQTLVQKRPASQAVVSEQLPTFSAITAFLLVAYPQTEPALKESALEAIRLLIPSLSHQPLATGSAFSVRTALILAVVANADYEQLTPEGQLEHVKYFNFHNDLAQMPLFNQSTVLDEAWRQQANEVWNRFALFLLQSWSTYRHSFLNGTIHVGFQRCDGYRRDGVLSLLSKILNRDGEHNKLIGSIDQAPPEELIRFFGRICSR